MADESSLYGRGELYDLLPNSEQDIAYWKQVLGEVSGQVLELGAGTGRLTIPLAQAGITIQGVDSSTAMLHRLREKMASAGLNIPLHAGDIRDFRVSDGFEAIFLPNNTLGHLHTREDFEKHLAMVRRHLLPDGIYLIDMFVPNPQQLTPENAAAHPVTTFPDPDTGETVAVTENSRYDHATQVKHNTWKFMRAGQVIHTDELNLRMYYPQELDALLYYNEFEIIAKYGAYDRSAFDASSKVQLIIAKDRS